MGRRPYTRPPQLPLLQLLQLLLLLPACMTDSSKGLNVNTQNEMKWIITIDRKGADDKCEINIGANEKFLCGTRAVGDQELAGGAVIVKNEGSETDPVDQSIKREKYSLTSTNNEDTVFDALRLYAQAGPKISLTDDSIKSEDPVGIKLPDCAADPYVLRGNGEEAQKDPNIPNKYTCSSSSHKTIFLKDESTGVGAVYCSVRGWRKDDHTFIKAHAREKVFCSTVPNPLPIFDNCGAKYCYIYDNMDNPKKLIHTALKPTMTDPLGVELDKNIKDKWILTMAWKGMESKCKFSIGDVEFTCDKNIGEKEDVSGVFFEKIKEGKSGNIKYEKYAMTPTVATEPIIDALKLYEKEKHKLKFSNFESEEIEFFKGCAKGVFTKENSEEPTKEVNKYSCNGRLNQVYLNDKNMFETEKTAPTFIYCTEGGWRNEARKVIAPIGAPIQKVLCYSEVQPLPVFDDCGIAKKFCYTYEDASTTLNKIIDKPEDNTLGVELDTRNKNEWILTLVWKGLEGKCQFTIGKDEFGCDKPKDFSRIFPSAGVKLTKKAHGWFRDIKYEKYIITPNVDGEPIIDALKLYEKTTHKLKLSDGTKNWESDETLFAGCETTAADHKFPEAIPTPNDVNKYSCSGRFNHVFLNRNDLYKDKPIPDETAVYCSEGGWRDVTKDRTVLKKYENEKVFCYTHEKYERLTIFEQCGDKIKCYIVDKTDPAKLAFVTDPIAKPALDAPNKDITLGVQLDTSNDDHWVLTMASSGMETDCKFTIGTVTFECAKDMGIKQDIDRVTFTKSGTGHDLDIKYEEYTITATNADDPSVLDALKLYKDLKHKLEFSGGGKTLTSDAIEFFKECTVNAPDKPFSEKAQKATKEHHNRFECKSHKLLPEIYLNGVNQKAGSTVYCSQRGWRKDDGSFLTKFANEQPYCYSANPRSVIPMFEDCDKATHACYAFDHMQAKFADTTPSKLVKIKERKDLKYNLGIDLDYSNDEKWTLIISYEDFEDFEFQIDQLPSISIKGKNVKDDIPLPGFPNVKVTYEQDGQDGTVFFHKFIFEPITKGDSLIDNLKLYQKAKYPVKIKFKDSKTFTHDDDKGIKFFEQGCLGVYTSFDFEKVEAATREHNKLSCPPASKPELKTMFLKYKMLDEGVLYCSKNGWREANGNLIKNYKDEQVFCSTLCQDSPIKMVNAVDNTGKDVKPEKDADKFDYKCLQGKASIMINGEFYDNVKCESNKWSGDGEDIKLEYNEDIKLESYKFEAKCFGAFLFLKDNCDTNVQKETGCQQPKLIANEKLECDDGFALTYGSKIYKSLKMVKGAWKDQDGNDVEKADVKKLPQCLSKCKPEYVTLLDGDLSEAAKYVWDETTNTGTLSCIDETNILIANFEGPPKSYFDDWTCDAKTGWKIKTGTETKDLKSIIDPAKFLVKAHCYKACDNTKVVKGCKAEETECKEFKYENDELSCGKNEVMFIVDAGTKSSVEQEKTPLVCSREGWKEKGEAALKYDHKVKKDVTITVQCVEMCAKRFRAADVDTEYNGNLMTCKGTKMISYKYPPTATAKETLHDLTCDMKEGWKDNGFTVINFDTGYKFKATCVDSCTNDWLVDNCATAARSECEKANLASDLITCAKKGHVLNYRDQTAPDPMKTAALEFEAIRCSKTAFENEPKDATTTKISLARVDPTTKIDVECISKCDKQFVTPDSHQKRKPTLDPGMPNSLTKSDTELECTDALHYTTLKFDGKPEGEILYTKDKFVCNPEEGWSASDLKGLLHSVQNPFSAKVGCFDVCMDRYTAKIEPPEDYIAPTYTDGAIKTINCGNEHTMSIASRDLPRETLECKNEGYLRQSNDEVILSFDNNDATKTFEMNCFSNCKEDLVTIVSSNRVTREGKLLKCQPDELLQIETNENTVTTRVFSDATCKPVEGWLGKVAKSDNSDIEDGTFVNFATNVRLQASCRKVCSNLTNMIDDCEDPEKNDEKSCQETHFALDPTDSTGSTHKLKCTSDHYRLFMKYGEEEEYEETGPSKCTRTGWRNEKDEIIKTMNFMDPAVKIEQKVHFKCKHKCHQDFIKDSCVIEGKDPSEVTCSKAIYDPVSRKMHCNHPSEVLVFEYAADRNGPATSKESFLSKEKVVNASCSDQGWKMEDAAGTEIFAMTKDNFHISARCEQMCHPALLTQSDPALKGSLNYELDGTLTCTDKFEKLIFDGKDWHTDLNCSSKGWIDATFDTVNKATSTDAKPIGEISFEARTEYTDRKFTAECIKSKCINPSTSFDRCKSAKGENSDRAGECKQPDFESRKYYVWCEDPMRIIKEGSTEIIQKLLRCVANENGDGDVWVDWDEINHKGGVTPFQDALSYENFICTASECAKCTDEKRFKSDCGGSDPNCRTVDFQKGSASFCSKYQCKLPGYRIGKAPSNYKYYQNIQNPQKKTEITCNKPGPPAVYSSPDGNSIVHEPIACVQRIPCVDFAPLNTTCVGLAVSCDEEGLKQNLTAASKMSAPAIQCAEDKQLYYSQSGGAPWTNFDRLGCQDNGQWVAYAKDNKQTVFELEKKTRVVCTESDPAGPKPTTTTPKPGICSFCALPPKKECDGCSTDSITTKEVNETCIATTANGHFVNEKKETVKSLKCKDEKTGVYLWRDGKGNEIKSLAVVGENAIISGANVGMITGIVIAALCVIGGVAGLVVFMHIRKKKETVRLETLKSKGLETKNDSIIDQIEVDDPKTIRL